VITRNGKHRARLDRLAVDHHGARAAQRRLAADVCAGQTKHVAQVMDQQQTRLDLVLLVHTVNTKVDSFLHELPHFVDLVIAAD
jgi:hypothetical protein